MLTDFSTFILTSFFILIISGFLLLAILAYFTRPRYIRNSLMTAAEREFYAVLKLAVAGKYDIFCQVRLASLVTLEKRSFMWEHFHPLGGKCVDFVLYDKNSGVSVLVIELDDTTHLRQDRQRRDQFVDLVLGKAHIPILHYWRKNYYQIPELQSAIAEKIAMTFK